MSSPDPAQLPHLLALLDDESGMVRDSVLGKLSEFGGELERELRQLADPPSSERIVEVLARIAQYRDRVRAFHEKDDEVLIQGALFKPGDLVRHRRYGYRGVVVDRDLECQADENWYRNNRTQPERGQPWYHVLVHDSDAATYAAQTSLLPDDSDAEVQHALLMHFFDDFRDGKYVRNDLAWPRAP